MGTTYHITAVRAGEGPKRDDLQRVTEAVLGRVDRTLSTYDPSSEISRFNRTSSTNWVPVSDDLYEVVSASIETSRRTSGAFDITVAPLLELWGFGDSATMASTQAPSAQALHAALELTGYANLELRDGPRALRKRIPGLRLVVDAIAPGFAVDEITAAFDALGVHDYIVEIGGEVRAHGRSPRQRSWRVAIEEPVMAIRRPFTIIDLDGRAISTSGDYRDVRVVGGRRVSHTIDPHTGIPVSHNLASVSVLHESTILADAYATALMVMGPQDGLRYAEQHDLAALFIVRGVDGTLSERATGSFARMRRYATREPTARH